MIKADMTQVKKFEDDLKEFKVKAYPYASRSSINTSAFKMRELAIENVRNNMILRNKFTTQSIQVRQARTLKVSDQKAIIGSKAQYAADQEFGGMTHKRGKNKTIIPTSYAAGQDGKDVRTKLPTEENKLKNIQLKKMIKLRKTVSKKQEIFLRALIAANEGTDYVLLSTDDGNFGIYRVWGQNEVNGRYTRIKMKMVYSMRRGAVRIPRNQWLYPASVEVVKYMPKIYEDALLFQLKKHGILGY